MPPYRKPQVLKVIVRSIFDRTLFVLGSAAAVAAPAGIIIWLAANVTVHGESLLSASSGALDPFAKLIGLDGVILLSLIHIFLGYFTTKEYGDHYEHKIKINDSAFKPC